MKFIKLISKFIKDFYNMWCGKDGRLSIRRVLGSLAFATLIYISIYSVLEKVTIMESVIWALVALIAGFFTLTTLSSSGELSGKLKDILNGKENNDGGN